MALHILINGAGIGGLTAALACARRGFRVTVLERASELGEVGAGIQIPPNAMRVLDALGVAESIRECAFAPEALEARMGETGRPIFRVELRETSLRRWGQPYLHIHRADYIDALATACADEPGIEIRLGTALQGYELSDSAVMATTEAGERIAADLVVGADGIHSVVREQMFGPDAPRFTGNVAWRAVVPVSELGDLAPPPAACLWMGRGRHCVTYRLRGGTLANLVAVVERDDWQEEGWRQRGEAAEALADFPDWHPTIRTMLERADTLYRWALFDRAPLPRWMDGPVALLGDAAHPMLPFMAQGAAMAVEDAYVLARELADAPDTTTALQRYQNARLTRTSKVQAVSRANATTFHQRTLAGQIKTYAPMWLAGKLVPNAIHARQDWLYSHDVVQSEP